MAAMKELAEDESLSEETRESAKQALSALHLLQVLEVNKNAALRKLEIERISAAKTNVAHGMPTNADVAHSS